MGMNDGSMHDHGDHGTDHEHDHDHDGMGEPVGDTNADQGDDAYAGQRNEDDTNRAGGGR